MLMPIRLQQPVENIWVLLILLDADEYVENADEINKKIALEKKLKEKEEKKNKKTKLSFL
jgi:hypothetical protein